VTAAAVAAVEVERLPQDEQGAEGARLHEKEPQVEQAAVGAGLQVQQRCVWAPEAARVVAVGRAW
jgi:hypothetical protein